MTWELVTLPGTRVQHYVPQADDIDHELTWDCPCGPATQGYFGRDGVIGWGIVHRALDGRRVST